MQRLVQLEREVKEEFLPLICARLLERIKVEEARLAGSAPNCPRCGRKMKVRGCKPCVLTSQFGDFPLSPAVYRCRPCQWQMRPLWTWLGLETGYITGALALLVALLGVIVPCEMAAPLASELFGVAVCPMTVWREVQRLGSACEAYQEESMRYFNDPRCEPSAN